MIDSSHVLHRTIQEDRRAEKHVASEVEVTGTVYHLRKTFADGLFYICGPGSSVGIATGYGLDGPGIEARWGRNFPHLSRPVLGSIQPPVQWKPGLSRG
jgi:hypothetical protein